MFQAPLLGVYEFPLVTNRNESILYIQRLPVDFLVHNAERVVGEYAIWFLKPWMITPPFQTALCTPIFRTQEPVKI